MGPKKAVGFRPKCKQLIFSNRKKIGGNLEWYSAGCIYSIHENYLCESGSGKGDTGVFKREICGSHLENGRMN
jgi:hypothetical protein